MTVIKDLSNDKNKFKLALKKNLLHNSFYSLEEYFNTYLTIYNSNFFFFLLLDPQHAPLQKVKVTLHAIVVFHL
jgi:hypothetical protein